MLEAAEDYQTARKKTIRMRTFKGCRCSEPPRAEAYLGVLRNEALTDTKGVRIGAQLLRVKMMGWPLQNNFLSDGTIDAVAPAQEQGG